MICLEIHKPSPEPPMIEVACMCGDRFTANLGRKESINYQLTSALKFVSIKLGEFAKYFNVVLLGNACAVIDDLHQQYIFHFRILNNKKKRRWYTIICTCATISWFRGLDTTAEHVLRNFILIILLGLLVWLSPGRCRCLASTCCSSRCLSSYHWCSASASPIHSSGWTWTEEDNTPPLEL